MKKHKGPRRYKVKSNRNSDSSLPVEKLDWNNWWTDGLWWKTPTTYIHVKARKGLPDWKGTVHRVYCRYGKKVRLAMFDGELYWLVDK